MPDNKWTTGVIRIETDQGSVQIAARVLGPIAVHFGVGSMAGRICITHVGTGYRIGTADDAQGARKIGEALAEEDWERVTDCAIPEDLRFRVSSILRREAHNSKGTSVARQTGRR